MDGSKTFNIASSVTFNLKDLNKITFINRNANIRLEVVVSVGVSSFITSRGLSFFLFKVSFSINTIFKYKVILTNGTLGGTMMHPTTTLYNHLFIFIDFNKATGYDENASVITSLVYYYGISHTISTQMVYTGPLPSSPSAVFSNFLSVLWVTINSARVNTMRNITIELLLPSIYNRNLTSNILGFNSPNCNNNPLDLITGYKTENIAALKVVRTKYNLNRVFTRRVLGGFKIPA
ncbi:hypothetical protein B0T21DRAFT_384185 [Apiosordaria backusii]|uniref:Uncharacterized protein n=1 Tax=Apiosordaria backusii TaxID=314023 RepID=A0AA40BM93_9PEZI|nr:hypothetical protein B0T21DRAFT_384185 [Apiosordaria backusii]